MHKYRDTRYARVTATPASPGSKHVKKYIFMTLQYNYETEICTVKEVSLLACTEYFNFNLLYLKTTKTTGNATVQHLRELPPAPRTGRHFCVLCWFHSLFADFASISS
jgi:hypothetical protein